MTPRCELEPIDHEVELRRIPSIPGKRDVLPGDIFECVSEEGEVEWHGTVVFYNEGQMVCEVLGTDGENPKIFAGARVLVTW